MSLLGLVRHLAEMERATFREMIAGQDVPRPFYSGTDPGGDFDGAVPDPGWLWRHGTHGARRRDTPTCCASGSTDAGASDEGGTMTRPAG
jgi:Protein of unknown function (DUF664)